MLKIIILMLAVAFLSIRADARDGLVRLNGQFVEGGCHISALVIELGSISSSESKDFPVTIDECHETVLSTLSVTLEGIKDKIGPDDVFTLNSLGDGRKIDGIGILFLDNNLQPIAPGDALVRTSENTNKYDMHVKYVISNGNVRPQGVSSVQWLTLVYF